MICELFGTETAIPGRQAFTTRRGGGGGQGADLSTCYCSSQDFRFKKAQAPFLKSFRPIHHCPSRPSHPVVGLQRNALAGNGEVLWQWAQQA